MKDSTERSIETLKNISHEMDNNIGVLLIGFNRSQLLIENYKHTRKFWKGPIVIVIDGQRKGNEQDKFEQEKMYSFFQKAINVNFINADINRGCRDGVTWAISQGFKLFNSLFIIEDDCFISENWFIAVNSYIQKNIKEQDLILIASDCKFRDQSELKCYYNDSSLIWGWFATKKVWGLNKSKYSDSEIINISKRMTNNVLFNYANMYRFFSGNKIDTWDYAFKLSMLAHGVKTLSFNKRFCDNVGHGIGTHQTSPSKGIKYNQGFDIENLLLDQKLHLKHKIEDIYTIKSVVQGLLIFLLVMFRYKIEGGKLSKLSL